MKKGFTLVELLAVIVILVIISLIAVPVILNLLSDSKKKAKDMSVENYLSAVEIAISTEKMNNRFNPNVCVIKSDGNLLCDGNKELGVDINGERPTGGWIIIEDGSTYKYSMSLNNGNVSNTEENPFLVDAYYNLQTSSLSTPTIDSNNITMSVEAGYEFRIDLPFAGYSFDWTISGVGVVYFYSESGNIDTIISHSGALLDNTEKYVNSEPGYILFDSNGSAFSIKNLTFLDESVTFNLK